MDDATYEKMRQAQSRYHHTAMTIPGVHGTSIGLKQVDGEATATFAICIHLTKKRPLRDVAQAERIPSEIEGFPTDVVEHDQPEPHEDNSKRRPVLGGIQLAVELNLFTTGFGTLGCIVRDRSDSQACALSNQHVLEAQGKPVCQPKVDACDRIGDTKRTVLSSDVDAGISTLNINDVTWEAKIVEIGAVKGARAVTSSQLPCPVRKRGRTTLLTHGKITNLSYSGRRTDGWNFTNQYFIVPDSGSFTEPGDSGSAVVDNGDFVVGLLWGGSSTHGAASPVEAVLGQLNVDMITSLDAVERSTHEETTVGRLERLLAESDRGRGYWSAFRRHKIRVRHMFHEKPRLYATWRKIPAMKLLEALHVAAADPDSKIPVRIGNMDTVVLVTKLRDMLTRYVVERELKEQIDSLHALIEGNIGKSWRRALSD